MSGQSNGGKPIDLNAFPAHIVERFNIHKMEPWGRHFTSLDPKYLEDFRAALGQGNRRGKQEAQSPTSAYLPKA
jgi:hypothetical protein